LNQFSEMLHFAKVLRKRYRSEIEDLHIAQERLYDNRADGKEGDKA